MKTRNAMQLKALIKSRSIEIGLTPQQALHAYYMECFVNRLAHSDYLDNFVLKGGYLISNLIGFESRTTMDVDSTIKNLPIEEIVTMLIPSKERVKQDSKILVKFSHFMSIEENADYIIHIISEASKLKDYKTFDFSEYFGRIESVDLSQDVKEQKVEQ